MSNNSTFRRSVCWLLISALLFTGCAGSLGGARGSNYLLSYTMTEPVVNNALVFRDKYLIVQFAIDESAISFQLQNISEAPMSIVWSDVSIAVNKRTFPVRNSSTFYATPAAEIADVVIPPLGYIRDVVIPRENVMVKDGKWVERQFFLTNDRGSKRLQSIIQRSAGYELALTLPVKIGDVVVKYPFVFKVSTVKRLPDNVLPPLKSRPPAPAIESSSAPWVPIFIAATVLGVTIYIVSQKKTPAGDI